jgi:hypothetical protein
MAENNMVCLDLNLCAHLYIIKIYNYPKYLKNHLSFELILILLLFLLKMDLFNLFNLRCLLFINLVRLRFLEVCYLYGKNLHFFARDFYFFKMT